MPPDLAHLRPELGPAEAWRRLVDLALAERVRAVVLAGDVLDDESDFFEAYGDLRKGAERLAAAGVELVTVAGNHDVDVLPRLSAAVDGVKLLGAGGTWEAHTLLQDGVSLNLVGWSWPGRWVETSPLVGLDAALGTLGPGITLAVLHCDLDKASSRYAPVASSELADGRVDAWLLGHVHKPSFARTGGGAWSGYLGSLSSADPGEEGWRGAWLLDASRSGLGVERVPLSPLRFGAVTVDVSGLEAADVVSGVIADAVVAHLDDLPDPGSGGPIAVGVRVDVVGRTRSSAEVRERLAREDPRDLLVERGGVAGFVHEVTVEVHPDLDVDALARRDDPVGLLARNLLLVDGPPSPERDALLEQVRDEMRQVASASHYAALEPPELTDEYVLGTLRRAAMRFLDEAMR